MQWHAMTIEETILKLSSSPGGLSETRAKELLATFGRNAISIKKKASAFSIFMNQFKNALVLLLLLAALISFGIGIMNPAGESTLDAVLIFAIVIANAVFGFFQEYKAEQTIESLTKLAAPRATVLRDGIEVEIPSEEVVPGDLLLLYEGDKVAADARIIECFSVYADESMLTGESVPVLKSVAVISERTPMAERSNLVLMGSVITRGRGKAIVVSTGIKTEMGAIAKEISEAPEKRTMFQLEIEDIGKRVSVIIVIILILVAASELLLKTGDLIFIFMAAVALGVAAIPEGLPAVVTLTLSIATNRLLKQNALMRRLSTIQDLGSVDVICTDKTGTLTENTMTVTRIYGSGLSYDVSGKGTDVNGSVVPDGATLASPVEQELGLLFKCAVLCNDARKSEDKFRGDPTEIAVLIPAYKCGLEVIAIRNEYQRVDEIPFSSETKIMATLNRSDSKYYLFVKGAPEVLLSRCKRLHHGGNFPKPTAKPITPHDRTEILGHNDDMASGALRVLAFAYKEISKPTEGMNLDNELDGLIFLGLMGMIDPPREGVREAVEDCRKAGVRVVMITGDNPRTATAIGRELGFVGHCMLGADLDGLSVAQLSKVVEETDIYARTSPKHKVILLKALQKNGHVVAMTGDGVNDAAAIKNSDVGIAMGIRGTEVTKQASDIIILDDNFISIRNAIAEGRGTFDNIRKFVVYLLGANISEVLIVFLSTVLGFGLSTKIAIQLLWINLATDGLPALALGIDPPTKGIMQRTPRNKAERVMDSKSIYMILSIGISATIALLGVYAWALSTSSAIKAQTVLFSGFVILEMLIVYFVRWKHGSGMLSNNWLHVAVASSLILQAIITFTPLSSLFGIMPLGISELEELAAVLAIFMVLMTVALTLEPYIMQKKKRAK